MVGVGLAWRTTLNYDIKISFILSYWQFTVNLVAILAFSESKLWTVH